MIGKARNEVQIGTLKFVTIVSGIEYTHKRRSNYTYDKSETKRLKEWLAT